MKKITILCLLSLFSLVAISQEMRFVKGIVLGKNGQRLSGVAVKAKNTDTSVFSKEDGTFEIKVPFYTTRLEASNGNDRVSAKIDGGYIVLQLAKATNKTNTLLESKTSVISKTEAVNAEPNNEITVSNANTVVEGVVVAANCKSGMVTYRGTDVATGKELFRYGPISGTAEIGEFLAVVHALTYLKTAKLTLPVFSDNEEVFLWIKKSKCRAEMPENATEQLKKVVARSEKWLKENYFKNHLVKWDSEELGKNPALIEE